MLNSFPFEKFLCKEILGDTNKLLKHKVPRSYNDGNRFYQIINRIQEVESVNPEDYSIEFHKDSDKIKSLKMFDLEGRISREDGPAEIEYRKDGSLFKVSYKVSGLLHRINAPAYFSYENDTLSSVCFFNNGNLHNFKGPAKITFGKKDSRHELYFVNGIPLNSICTKEIRFKLYYPSGELQFNVKLINRKIGSSDNSPSWTEYYKDGTKKVQMWFKNGLIHSDCNKAPYRELYENGNLKREIFFKEGIIHKDIGDGPAWIDYYSNRNLKRHIFLSNGIMQDQSISQKASYYKFYNCGYVMKRIRYSNGVLNDGISPAYTEYREGKKAIQIKFFQGVISDGTSYFEYHRDGSHKTEATFLNGKIYQKDLKIKRSFITYYKGGSKKYSLVTDPQGFVHCAKGAAYIEYPNSLRGKYLRKIFIKNGEFQERRLRKPNIISYDKKGMYRYTVLIRDSTINYYRFIKYDEEEDVFVDETYKEIPIRWDMISFIGKKIRVDNLKDEPVRYSFIVDEYLN